MKNTDWNQVPPTATPAQAKAFVDNVMKGFWPDAAFFSFFGTSAASAGDFMVSSPDVDPDQVAAAVATCFPAPDGSTPGVVQVNGQTAFSPFTSVTVSS